MDTGNFQDVLLQPQNRNTRRNVHFQPHLEASSTSLLQPNERTGREKYRNATKLKRPSVLKFFVFSEIVLCVLVLGFSGNLSHTPISSKIKVNLTDSESSIRRSGNLDEGLSYWYH